MSYPRLGNQLETNGNFSVNFNWERVYKNGVEIYSINPLKESFSINNEYYDTLFKEGKVSLYWSVFCSKTFFFTDKINFEKVQIETINIGGPFEINYYLIANQDFTFSPLEGSVNDFFKGEYIIEKGSILSVDDRREIIRPKIIEVGASSSIIKFKLDSKIENEFRVEFDKDKFIWISIKDKKFIKSLNRLLLQKSSKALIVNSFFGATLIDAIRQLSDDENQYSWKEDLKNMIEFDENKKDLYSEFDYAMNQFNNKFFNDDDIFFHKLANQLENLF